MYCSWLSKIIFAGIACATCISDIFPQNEPDRLATHCMLIFLDTTEFTKPGALANLLITALSQKAAPILTTPHLLLALTTWNNAQQVLEKDPQTIQNKQFWQAALTRYDLVQKKLMTITESSPDSIVAQLNAEFPHAVSAAFEHNSIENDIAPIRHALIKSVFSDSFNATDWIIKQVNNNLVLLIPRSYKNTLFSTDLSKISTTPPSWISLGYWAKKVSTFLPYSQPQQAYSELEYQTGLKLDHMKTFYDLIDLILTIKDTDLPLDCSSAVTDVLHNASLFIPRSEYAKAQRNKIPRWAFYMSGHGKLGTTICDVSIPTFQEMLDFFNTRIKTGILAYTSCYAVGTNIELAYKDLEQQSKIYSFPIVTQGISDRTISDTMPSVSLHNFSQTSIDFDSKKLALQSWFNSQEFVARITKPDISDFIKAISPVMNMGDFKIPHIRLAGSEWFNIVDSENKIAALGSIFSKTCTSPVNLRTRFTKAGKAPEYYLLYNSIIPCELQINPVNQTQSPLFIPMAQQMPENQYNYFIKGIISSLYFWDVILAFLKTVPHSWNFQMWIDDIHVKDRHINDVVIDMKAKAQGTVPIWIGTSANIYYRKGNSYYQAYSLYNQKEDKILDYDYRTQFKKPHAEELYQQRQVLHTIPGLIQKNIQQK